MPVPLKAHSLHYLLRSRLVCLALLLSLFPLPLAAQQERDWQEVQRLDEELQQAYKAGRSDEAITLAGRVLKLREQLQGADHADLAGTLLLLAILYRDKGDYLSAEPPLQRALTIREKALGPEHPEVADCVYNLALLCRYRGDYERVGPLYRRTLAILEKAFGPEHPNLAGPLNELAVLYSDKGDFVQAEPLFQRVLTIRENTLGPAHPEVAESLFNLAILIRNKGDYRKAEPLFQRALAIQEAALGPDDPQVSDSLFNLAILYRLRGETAKAEQMLLRAVAIMEKRFGPDHPEVTGCLNELGVLYTFAGEFAKAEPIIRRVLTFREKTFGPDHHDVATSLGDLASLYLQLHDYDKAEPLFQRALAIQAKTFGPRHRLAAITLSRLAQLDELRGEIAEAVRYRKRASEINEHNLALNLAIGSEAEKMAYLNLLGEEMDVILSLHATTAPDNVAALELALTELLRHKGRAVDAMADSLGALHSRADEQGRELLTRLMNARAGLARLRLADSAGQQSQVSALEAEVEKLEADISRRSAGFRAQSQPVTLAAVQSLIPEDAALIEFARYRPSQKNQPGGPRYVAYVLHRTGAPQWVSLGEAQAIDDAVDALRRALRDPLRSGVERLARSLDEKLMRPVRALPGTARHLLISPDGSLNLIPFAALVDEQNRFLIERYAITYLTSGRDLLRLQARPESRSQAVIVADQEFGDPPVVYVDEKTGQRKPGGRAQFDPSRVIFAPLAGAKGELRALRELLPQAAVLTSEQATEAALRQLAGPQLLHIATHGLFLSPETGAKPEASSKTARGAEKTRLGKWVAQVSDPMLRSGLVLAGANRGSSDGDDGVLTALEAAVLDLWGTRLVVLSACDTGVGEVRNGDGVYGLRRALVVAGAESQLMSLWPVSDLSTRDLMIGYYKNLQQNQGRGEALRQVQLQMLNDPKRRHPFYWASFIQSGEWADLSGRRQPALK